MEKARNYCEKQFIENEKKLNFKNNSLYCPFYFDGILCWNQTKANSLAYQNCPSYVVGFVNSSEYATIFCTSDGSWERKKGKLNRTYTNYENCMLVDKEEDLLIVMKAFSLKYILIIR